MIEITVDQSGPVFDGRADEIVERYALEAGETVAEEGRRRVVEHLGARMAHPTGYYIDHVKVERLGQLHRVHDSNVRYGQWLAGTTDRNASTDFKGFDAFNSVRDGLQTDAVEIAESVLPPYIAELNGGA